MTDASATGELAPSRLTDDHRHKLRYLGVSIGFVPLGTAVFLLTLRLTGNATAASFITNTALAPPTFWANRAFVWRDESRSSLHLKMIVFWATSCAGVLLAAAFTAAADHLSAGRGAPVRLLVLAAAQAGGLGLAWLTRYVVADRWLFTRDRRA